MGGPELIAAGAGAGAAWLAWAARGRSSSVFGPSVWRGPSNVRAVALTFDDGPSPQTAQLAGVLDRARVRATFFSCGVNVRRYPEITRALVASGHEIGNHSDTHARFWLRSASFIRSEIARAQETIAEAAGRAPVWFRAPYGVRWFGVGAAQREFGLRGAMWTVIGCDWKLDSAAVSERIVRHAVNGAILCLHDGRETAASPDISNTVAAVRDLVPRLLDAGYEFRTLTELMG